MWSLLLINVLKVKRGHTSIIHIVKNFLAKWNVDLKIDGLLITCAQSVLLVFLVKFPVNDFSLLFLCLRRKSLLSLLYFKISLIS